MSQTWSKPKPKRGAPFKIISGATDGVSQPQVKAQQQVRASQMQSYVTHAPAVEFWMLEIALSANDDKRMIQPEKINTLAYGFRAWGALGGRE